MEKLTNSKNKNEKPIQTIEKKSISHSKEVYNEGIRPITIKKTLRENIVLHPKKSMRFASNIAEELCKQHKDLVVKAEE